MFIGKLYLVLRKSAMRSIEFYKENKKRWEFIQSIFLPMNSKENSV